MTQKQSGNLFWGIVFIAGGSLLLAERLGYLPFDFSWEKHWPVVLILVGLSTIIRSFVRNDRNDVR
jgi:hypothetical protein